MVSVLDQGEHDIVLGKPGAELDRVLPRHIGILHTLKDADRTTGFDHVVEQEVTAALLDQAAGDGIGLVGIWRRPAPPTGRLDPPLDLRRKALHISSSVKST